MCQTFVGTIGTHNLPFHIRSDQGRENILIAQYMTENIIYSIIITVYLNIKTEYIWFIKKAILYAKSSAAMHHYRFCSQTSK